MSDTPAASSPTPASATPTPADTPQAADAKEQQPAAPVKSAPPKYRKIKAGDEELTLSDDDIAKNYQKWKGADAKFREAAEAKKSVEAFMKQLQEDPEAVLNDPRLPIDRKKLAEKWLVKQLESELNPPDPRDAKLSETERKLKEYEDKEAKAKADVEAKEYEAAREQRKAKLSETLGEAMKATHLSAHPESAAGVLREMAMFMRAARERGEEVTPQELVEHIHSTRFNQLYTLAHQFDGEQLIEFLGEEIVTRIRKADLAKLRAKREQGQSHRTEPQERTKSDKRPPRMDAIQAKKHAQRLFG